MNCAHKIEDFANSGPALLCLNAGLLQACFQLLCLHVPAMQLSTLLPTTPWLWFPSRILSWLPEPALAHRKQSVLMSKEWEFSLPRAVMQNSSFWGCFCSVSANVMYQWLYFIITNQEGFFCNTVLQGCVLQAMPHIAVVNLISWGHCWGYKS